MSSTPTYTILGEARSRLATWWIVLRIALEERLVYRGDFALGTLMRFLPIITQIFLWWAIFESISAESTGAASTGAASTGAAKASATTLVGYSFPDMVAYYLLTMLARAFSSMPGLASGVARQIREGEIKKYLTQPVDLIGFLLLGRIAHKLAYYSVATLPFAFVFFLCRGYFTTGWPEWSTLIAFMLTLAMSFLLGFFMEICLGLVGFWFLEVSSLLFVYMLFNFFLSGHMFPLDMLPEPWNWIVEYMPLKYLAYYPAAVFLGKVPQDQLGTELLIEFAWLVFFILLARWMYARGLRRYSGFGG